LVPLALGILLALQLHAELAEPNVSPFGFAAFLGVVLSISAFPVVARILAERRLLRSRLGVVTITCVAIDDVIAWCLAAFVIGWARADGVAAGIWTSALAVAYVASMLLIVRPLLERLARRFASSPELGHDRIAGVLLLLFASSWATALIGIHAMFGAFLFGAILPRDGGLAHALADKLEDLVVVVLLPLFFAYSGVRTHIGLLDSSAAWSTCALIIVVACVGKLGASTLAARVSGLSWRESTALGVLMNTRGLVVLVMLNIGLDLGIISATLFTMLVIMALFTTFLATPVLDVVYPIGQHVTDLLTTQPRDDAPLEPALEPGFSLLLCFADGGPSRGLRALAGTLADAPGVRLQALQLRRPARGPAAIEPHEPTTLPVKHMSFVSSDPANDICRVAEVKVADLVLIERDGAAERERDWAGPTTRRVLLECRRDVAVLVATQLERVERVLVLSSQEPSSEAARAVAARLAAAGVEIIRGAAKPSELARFDDRIDRIDLLVLADEPRLLEHGLEWHARGVSLLVVRSGATAEPATGT
jgi:Kef-type K+ transport system membrane component KefB